MRGRTAIIGLIALGIPALSPSMLTADAAAASCPTGATCLYVSNSGRDQNPGTALKPIKTVAHAQELVRRIDSDMHSNILVLLEGNGPFRLSRPLVFGSQDSGTNGFTVKWTASSGSSPVISGAVRVSGWSRSLSALGIWSARIPAHLMTREIYVNGERAQLTEGPVPTKLTPTATGYSTSSRVMDSWRNPSAIEFGYPGQLGQMSEPICPIASIHGTTISMAQPCWNNSTRRKENSPVSWSNNDLVANGSISQPGYVENAYELLRQPGQFYLDPTAHRLYYIPRPGQFMPRADVEVPDLQHLIVGAGTPTAPVHNITFSGLQFSYATWLQPSSPEGFSEVQAGYSLTGPSGYATEGLCQLAKNGTCPYGAWTQEPGNLEFSYDRHISFERDRFISLGAAALDLNNGSQDDQVQGCIFTDISGNGIELGNTNLPEAMGGSQTIGNTLANNHLFDLPLEYHGGVAILAGYVSRTLITHNQIDHVSYTGISMGWGGWIRRTGAPAVQNNSHDNQISDNLIFDFLQYLADGGGIYTQGSTGPSLTDGELVSGNVIHDEVNWGAGLKSDNGTADVTYTNNVMYNDIYDWNSNHVDGPEGPPTFGPEMVEDNYWQQGDTDFGAEGITQTGNSIIGGATDAPATILASAGLEPAFQTILSWNDPGAVADSPSNVDVVTAAEGNAYVTVQLSLDPAVTSYTLVTCRVVNVANRQRCGSGPGPLTMTASALYQTGYFEVSGLVAGRPYSFQVIAHAPGGSSIPSLPSPLHWAPSAGSVPPPTQPTNVWEDSEPTSVSVGWYRPASDNGWAGLVLGFLVTSSGGEVAQLPGRLQLRGNGGGKTLAVVYGLSPGQTYTISVAALGPGGLGPPTKITATTTSPPAEDR